MDKRKKQILDILSKPGFFSAEILAAELQCSTKTIRNLIRDCNSEFDKQDAGASILSKYGAGYYLEVADAARFEDFYNGKSENLNNDYLPSTSEERVQYILEYLFNCADYVKLEALSDMLYISKRTITTDLKDVEQFLLKYNIELVRKPNYGIKIRGSEFDKRLCIAAFAGKRLNKGNKFMDEIAESVTEVLQQNDFTISGVAFQNLVVHLFIAISRIEEKHCVPMPKEQIISIREHPDYGVACKLIAHLEQQFGVSFPESEIAYVTIHLAGKQVFAHGAESEDAHGNFVISQELSNLVTEMLERVYEAFKFDFRKDLELRMTLCQHLVPLDIRIRYGMSLKNPLLEDVKEKYCLAYTIACSAVTVINERYGKILSEDETGYFAFAFALALERKRTESERKNILLVCASGKGSAQLLLYKYKSIFGAYINKIEACDVGRLYKKNLSEFDYVFTTVPIPFHIPIPIQEVQHFLDDTDIANVKKMLSCENGSFVEDYYHRDFFLPHLDCRTKEEVLDFMCHYVMEKKGLPKEFYASVLERESLAQTAFGNMVAMPHSNRAMSPDTFVCVAVLDEPVDWGEHKVQAVFLVCIADKDNDSIELQRFYQMTASFLLSQKHVQDLIRRRDYDRMVMTLGEIEAEMPDVV